MSSDGHGRDQRIVFVRAEDVDDQTRVRLALSRLTSPVPEPVRVEECPAADCWKAPGEAHWHIVADLTAYPGDAGLLAVCPGDRVACPVTDPDHVCAVTPF